MGHYLPFLLLVSGSGLSVLTVGTTQEPGPTDDEWETATSIVSTLVHEFLGGTPFKAKALTCAAVEPIAVTPETVDANA